MDTSLNVAYGPAITAAANRHHLQPRLLAAVAAQETGGPGSNSGRNIVGDQGHGHGLFQIDDRWHTFARSPAAMDPAKNATTPRDDRLEPRPVRGDVHKRCRRYNAGSPPRPARRPIGATEADRVRRLGPGGTTRSSPEVRPIRPRSRRRRRSRLRPKASTPCAARPAFCLLAPSSPGQPVRYEQPELGDGQSTSSTSADAYPPMMMPLNLPAYKPLAQVDSRDRDVAPSSSRRRLERLGKDNRKPWASIF